MLALVHFILMILNELHKQFIFTKSKIHTKERKADGDEEKSECGEREEKFRVSSSLDFILSPKPQQLPSSTTCDKRSIPVSTQQWRTVVIIVGAVKCVVACALTAHKTQLLT